MNRTQLRYAANLKWLFSDVPLAERFDAAAQEGFEAVEIPAPYDLSASELRRHADDAGVQVVLINAPQAEPGAVGAGGFACLPGMEQDYRDSVKRGLEYADRLGAGLLHVVGGRRPADVSRDRAIAHYVHNISWAVDRARGSGIRIVLEMQNQRSAPRFVAESQALTAAVVEAVGEGCALLLDVFHLQVQQGDIGPALDEYLPATAHIQIGDAPDRSEPGTGELRWRYIADRIRRSGYRGWVGCEFTPTGGNAGLLERVKAVM